ncbi:MAG: hypothetical protein AAB198_03325 [Actinomycetota bacterium]
MTGSRDDNWAKPVNRLEVKSVPEGAKGQTVHGRRLTGPLQGFGQMWQKTYRVRIDGKNPEEVIAVWKTSYGRFWPKTNRFYAPIAGIKPGEIGLITGKSGPTKLSTGVMVLYADDRSFTYITPEGHPFAGWITFSAHDEDDHTIAQVSALIRANDPMYEVGFMAYGSRAEDKMWLHTLRALSTHLGSKYEPTFERVKVDKKRAWKNFKNIRRNAMLTGMFRRKSKGDV